jgi:hypothetical protein
VAHARTAALPLARTAAQVIAVPPNSIHSKAAATRLAEDALDLVTFPAGSTRLPKKPPLGTADLNEYLTITSMVSLTRWWSVPGQVADATAWFAANPPPGLTLEVPQGGPSIAWTAGAAAAFALNAALVQDGDHVDVSLGSQVIWTPAKTAVETIPSSVSSGTLDYYTYNGFGQDSRRVVTGANLAALVAGINPNPTAWLGSRSCAAELDDATLTVHYGGHEVVFTLGVSGCGGIGVTSDGKSQPGLTCCTTANPFPLVEKLGRQPSAPATQADPVPRQLLKELTSRRATDAADLALLASLPLPPGTRAEPTPEGELARSTINYGLTESRWFTVDEPATAAVGWFTRHLIRGFAVAHIGPSYQSATEIVEQAVGVYPSSVVLDIRVQASGATTAMRVDAEKFYLPTRSPAETIPTSTRSALLTFEPYPPNAAQLPTRRVDYHGTGLKALISWLNTRPAQWNNYSPTCATRPGPAAKLGATFTVGRRVVTFYWYGTDCAVNVLINGKGSRSLTGPPTSLVERLLKITAAPTKR